MWKVLVCVIVCFTLCQCQTITYHINVWTEDKFSAGTDADIYIKITGTSGKDTGEIELSNNENNFEQGDTDTFKLNALNVGAIKQIQIFSKAKWNTKLTANWWLKMIHINVPAHRKIYIFKINAEVNDGDRPIYEPGRIIENTIAYEITIRTGDKNFDGTDADVFLNIFGPGDKSTGEFMLDNPNVNEFEMGDLNVFKIYQINVGEIKKIKFSEGGQNADPKWKPVAIRISVPSEKTSYMFSNDKYIKGKDNSPLIPIKVIRPQSVNSYKGPAKTTKVVGAFTMVPGEFTFEEAQQACKKIGARLAVIKSLADQKHANEETKVVNHPGCPGNKHGRCPAFISLLRGPDYVSKRESQFFRWVDGCSNFMNFGTIISDIKHNCAETSGKYGQWYGVECTSKRNALCDFPPPVEESTFQMIQGGFTYEEAKQECWKRGGKIAVIKNQDDQNKMREEIKAAKHPGCIKNGQSCKTFIAYRRESPRSHFFYWDGGCSTYSNFNKGEPNDYALDENCVDVYGDEAYWVDISCNSKLNVLCEFGPQRSTRLQEMKVYVVNGYR